MTLQPAIRAFFSLLEKEREKEGPACLNHMKPLKLPKPELVNLVFSRQTPFVRAEIRVLSAQF